MLFRSAITLAVAAFLALGGNDDARLAVDAGAADAGAAPTPASLPACIQVQTESRYVPYGYNHIVTLTSGCTRPASCTVSTDVNPEVHAVDVPANASIQVTTYIGAAASAFVAKVACKLR